MTNFWTVFAAAAYISVGYTFAHVTFNKTEEAFKEGRITTPQWGRFLLSLAVIVIWPVIPFALTARYVTQHWRNHV